MATVVLSAVHVCVYLCVCVRQTGLAFILGQCEDQVFRNAIHRGLFQKTAQLYQLASCASLYYNSHYIFDTCVCI